MLTAFLLISLAIASVTDLRSRVIPNWLVGLAAVAKPVDRVAGLAQARGQRVAEVGVVFEDQQAHRRTLTRSTPPQPAPSEPRSSRSPSLPPTPRR